MQKGIPFRFFFIFLLFSFLSGFSGSGDPSDPPPFAGGSGSSSDPWKVSTPAQLDAIRLYPQYHFILTSHINLGVSPWNSGEGWLPIGGQGKEAFSGSLRGNGFRITGLTIQRPDSSYAGLFGRCVGAVLQGITLENVSVNGKNYVGGLAGEILGGEVNGCEVSGSVTGTGDYTGGLCGLASGCTLKNCISGAMVSGHCWTGGLAGWGSADGCRASGRVTGVAVGVAESLATGGLLGAGQALNCEASGAVTGGSLVGGLLGSGQAHGCYSSGDVTATGDYVGGLIGDMVSGEEDQPGEEAFTSGTATPPVTTSLTKSVTTSAGEDKEIFLPDGTRLLIPASATPMDVSIEKKPFDIVPEAAFPPGSNFRSTGSLRQVTIRGIGDPPLVKPIITIPASEAGSINPETVNAVRVGSLFENGELVEEHTSILPVFLDDNGNYKFIDALFPDGIIADSSKSASLKTAEISAREEDQVSEKRWIGNVRYYLMSFDKSFNWSQRAVLERMVPDSTLTEEGFRKPWSRVSPKEREKVKNQPICNVIILVHGHNEEEKDGYVGSRIVTPWEFNYKRLVWDLLYENISKNRAKDFPAGCTATYEFIFPTYRPIFSPVSDKTGLPYTTLGENLGQLINQEMENNPQLKAMLDNDMPFNLFVVAHSQGGVVARAGLRFVDPKILEKVKLVVTWGSPHRGAGLYSLRYALTVGHDIVIDGYRFPLQNIGQGKFYQSAVEALALDAPRIRDIRWDASKKEMLRFDSLFVENKKTINEFRDTELPYGKMFFSDNLRIFNEAEGRFMGDKLRSKYKFYEATTDHLAPLDLTSDWWGLAEQVYYFRKHATSIEKGAMLNKLVMKAGWASSDGAVPVYSQGARGIWSEGNIQTRKIDHVDHEEFYGAEVPQRDANTIAKGNNVVRMTFSDMEFSAESRSCPTVESTVEVTNDSLFITGKLIFPIYDKSNGGDDLPGKLISIIVAAREHPDSLMFGIYFKFKEDGTFEGKGRKSEIPNDTLFVVIFLKDGSRVVAKAEREIENLVHNETKNKWYSTIQMAVNEAESDNILTVYPGIYREDVLINEKNLILNSADGPEETIVEGGKPGGYYGFRVLNSEVTISGFTIRKFRYGVYLKNTASDGTSLSPLILGNIFTDNDKGIYFMGSYSALIRGNMLYSAGDFGNNGIAFDRLTSKKGREPVKIENNVISGADEGVRIDGEAWVAFSGNSIRNNRLGAYIQGESMVQFSGDTLENNTGHGISIWQVQNPVSITNCTFRNNVCGISCATDYGHHIVTGCTITGNSTGINVLPPGLGKVDSRVTITSNTITGNTFSDNFTDGGGIRMSCPGEISGNTISENVSVVMGGGIYLNSNNVTIKKNTITGNSAYSGGGIYVDHLGVNALIQENTISGNQTGGSGGGLYTGLSAAPVVTGNKFSDNYAAYSGGAVFGLASGWVRFEEVTVEGETKSVFRYVPCFTETTNTYSGNSHGKKFGAWGPGVDNWCPDAGYDVYPE